MRLKEYVDKCHQMAREKGFHDEPRQLAVDIALLHSELSEVLEAEVSLALPGAKSILSSVNAAVR